MWNLRFLNLTKYYIVKEVNIHPAGEICEPVCRTCLIFTSRPFVASMDLYLFCEILSCRVTDSITEDVAETAPWTLQLMLRQILYLGNMHIMCLIKLKQRIFAFSHGVWICNLYTSFRHHWLLDLFSAFFPRNQTEMATNLFKRVKCQVSVLWDGQSFNKLSHSVVLKRHLLLFMRRTRP